MADDICAKLAIPDGFTVPEATAKPNTSGVTHFIPAVPLRVIHACVDGGCEIALPLILAIHRQLTMTKRDRTPLNKAIWAAAGNPPEKKRARILAILRKAPELVDIQERKTSTSHYDVRYGSAWRA